MRYNFTNDNHLFDESESRVLSFESNSFLKKGPEDSFLLELTDEDLDQIAGGEQLHDFNFNKLNIK